MAHRDLPSGPVTFLFSDVEGSTRLLAELGDRRYAEQLAEHRDVVRGAFTAHGGVEVDTQGDSFFVAFPTAVGAIRAADEAQQALALGPVRARMGIHTGNPLLTDEGYVGVDVHIAARIAAAGHGGQVLLSRSTCDLVEAEVLDLGEHRLKDLPAPVWIFQLGTGRFPPLRTIANSNLPRPASEFVGRTSELSEVRDLVKGGARLVTLTGAGGAGKTRLAIEVASDLLSHFPNGVFWVPLAALRDPKLVTPAIAENIGASGDLIAHISDRRMLVVVDNLEQVIEAAVELSSLVSRCPNLHLVVTSRERLRVHGEVDYPVPALAGGEAVELFCARAGLDPSAAIAELCDALENLPLAVELAAARTAVLSPTQIRDRLTERLDLFRGDRDADPRQRTLRATIAWSHDLLDADERRLFARLAVFRGGFDLDAAQHICEAGVDTLSALIDKSLVRHRDERYSMLETIRTYAREQLGASEDASQIRDRHAEHYLELAEEAEPLLRSGSADLRCWLDRLTAEHDNLRGALDHLATEGRTHLVLRLAGAMTRFWYLKGHMREGENWLERAIAADERPSPARVRALNGAALMALNAPDLPRARRRATDALNLSRELGDRWGASWALFMLGHAAAAERDWEGGRDHFEESARRFEELGDEHQVLLVTRNLAWMYYELGDPTSAKAIHQRNVRRARATGNERMESTSLLALGSYAADEGRPEEALEMFARSLRIDLELGEPLGVVDALSRCARALAHLGQAALGASLLAHAERRCDELGTHPIWIDETFEEALPVIHERLDELAFREAWDRGMTMSEEEAVALALGEAGQPSPSAQPSIRHGNA